MNKKTSKNEQDQLIDSKKNGLKRRVLHIAGILFVGYYVLPETLAFSLNRRLILLLVFFLATIIEIYRRHTKNNLPIDPLLREYENHRPASFFYFTTGSIILLYLLPQYISIPCILSTAICDPIIGELKQKNKKLLGYLIGFFVGSIIFYLAWLSSEFPIALSASIIASITLIFAEYVAHPMLDDDLLMQIIPAILLFVYSSILTAQSIGLPGQLIYPFW
jgi:dolichol kinase